MSRSSGKVYPYHAIYQALKKKGLCSQCRNPVDREGVVCTSCIAKMSAYARSRRHALKQRGECYKCLAPCDGKSPYCKEHKQEVTLRWRKRREDSLAKGLCCRCRKEPHVPELKHCQQCLNRERVRNKIQRDRK